MQWCRSVVEGAGWRSPLDLSLDLHPHHTYSALTQPIGNANTELPAPCGPIGTTINSKWDYMNDIPSNDSSRMYAVQETHTMCTADSSDRYLILNLTNTPAWMNDVRKGGLHGHTVATLVA